MLEIPESVADALVLSLSHRCAVDPETGAYLSRSDGHRRAGRRIRFYLHVPGKELARVIQAWSLQEAITLANSYLVGVVTDESRH